MQVSLWPRCAISYQLVSRFIMLYSREKNLRDAFSPPLFLRSEASIKRCTTKEYFFLSLRPPVSQTSNCFLPWRTNLLSSPTIPVTQRLRNGVFKDASQSCVIAELLKTWVIVDTKSSWTRCTYVAICEEKLFFFSFALLMDPWRANKWTRGTQPLEEMAWKTETPTGG